MLALISEILLCLLAAAVIGFLIAWFLRMREVATLTAEAERLRATAPTGVLPSALATRLELLARMMEELKARPTAGSAAADLHRLLERQEALQGTVSELARRPAPTPPALDLTPMVQKLERLQGDGGEVTSKLASVTAALTALRAPDLSGLERRLDAVADRVDELARRPVPAVDLGPLQAIASVVDLSGVERRLDALAQEIAASQTRPASMRASPAPPPKQERDNLILIHGVGPVLQRLLHRMGIYRFEQVMHWGMDDVAAVTARLPSFKGRIEREGWVESARREYEKKYGEVSSAAEARTH